MTYFVLIMFHGNHLGVFCLAGLPGGVHRVARLAIFGAILVNFHSFKLINAIKS